MPPQDTVEVAGGVPRRLITLVVLVLAAGLTLAAVDHPARVDRAFADRLMTAIGARTDGGTVACAIPGELRTGQRFECHGTDRHGTFSVEVVILDRQHHFQLSVAPTV